MPRLARHPIFLSSVLQISAKTTVLKRNPKYRIKQFCLHKAA